MLGFTRRGGGVAALEAWNAHDVQTGLWSRITGCEVGARDIGELEREKIWCCAACSDGGYVVVMV
jgi:hypothetical protein